jgi:branched-chain amino acid aminotransferase
MKAYSESQNEIRIINLNGKVIPASGPVFDIENRSFRYGDGMFETIRMIKGRMPLFSLHFKRLLFGCNLLKLRLPAYWEEETLAKEISELAVQAEISDNARIRLTIFRQSGGFYTPLSNKAEYLIEVSHVKKQDFAIAAQGIVVDLFTDIEKPTTQFSAIKTNNALIYVLAAIHKHEHGLDDCLLINNKSRVIESIDSNLFIVTGGEIHTPPTAEGCVAGVMRDFVISIIREQNIPFRESALSLEELFNADEMFLTNSIQGIKWVSHYKVKQYDNYLSSKLASLINNNLMH